MSITVNLWSKNSGEIEDFLKSFYETDIKIGKGERQWLERFDNPLESVDIISAVMDNNDKYDITLYVQVNHEDLYRVTEENYNDVVKGIFILYYDKNPIWC